MEADRLLTALEYGGLQIVIQQHPGQGLPGVKGGDMATQETLHAGIEIKTQEDLTAPAEHHHERHQRSFGAANSKLTKASPVHLSFFAR
jgi:hypothetical protein